MVSSGGTLSGGVRFGDSSGEIVIANGAGIFGATIASFTRGDAIDLTALGFCPLLTLATFVQTSRAGGTLTITNNFQSATLSLLGQFTAASFVLTGDGNGGTLVAGPLAPAVTVQTNVLGPRFVSRSILDFDNSANHT